MIDVTKDEEDKGSRTTTRVFREKNWYTHNVLSGSVFFTHLLDNWSCLAFFTLKIDNYAYIA